MADADAALQAASPNYGQLVQQVVSAQDVFAALHPGEAFAAITLADQDGWVILLRDNTITVSKVAAGLPADRRAGEADPRGHRADHRRAAAVRHRRRAADSTS